MPDIWDTDTFRERARRWQERAQALAPGKEREQCVAIAEGYVRLTMLKEKIDRSRVTSLMRSASSRQKSCHERTFT
jgi:hypothetical protein